MLPVVKFFNFQIYTYPLIMGVAWALAFQLTCYLNNTLKKSLANIRLFFLLIFLTSWLGAKLFFILTVKTDHQGLLYVSSFWLGGGFVFYGGMLFGLLGCIAFFKFKKISFSTMNILLPALALGHAIGRVGCFLAGCCYGKITDSIMAIHTHGELRHPVQLYEAGLLFLLSILFFKKLTSSNKRNHTNDNIDQNLWVNYLLYYGLIRFITEIFRGDNIRGFLLGGLSTSQVISLIVVCVVLTNKVYTKIMLKKSLH